MPQVIVVPNGDELEFPDDTDDSVISEVIKREYGTKPVIQATPAAPYGGGFPSAAGQSESVIRAVPVSGLIDPSAQLPYPNQDVTDIVGGGQQIEPPPTEDSSFLSSLGQTTALSSIKGVEGMSNFIQRNILKTNEESRRELEAQLAEAEKAGQDDSPLAQKSRQYAETLRGRLGELGVRPETPIPGAVRGALGPITEDISELKPDIEEFYGANPESQNVGAQVGRGIGSVTAALPFMIGGPIGLVGGAGQMAAMSYQHKYDEILEKTGDPALAAQAGEEEAKKTGPALLAYMAGGKGAAALAGKLFSKTATPLTKGVLGGAAATGANIVVGSAIRGAEGGSVLPNFENLTMDALFGFIHGAGEYGNASKEVKAKAAQELKGRGVPEEAIPAAPVVDVEAGVVKTPEGHVDLTTGQKLNPIREQSLKSLGKLPEGTAPSTAVPHIVGTAVNFGGNVFKGKGLEPHKSIFDKNLEALLGGKDQAPVDLMKEGGFMVVDETGTERFATREEAIEIGKKSGQILEDFEGVLHSQVVKPFTPKAMEPAAPKVATPVLDVDLELVGRDAFERTSGEALEEGNVAYRDPKSQQVFQVPVDAPPEQVKGIVEAARAEEASAQRKARLEQHDLAVEEQRSTEAHKAFVQPEATVPKTNDLLWNNPLRLKNLRDEMVSQDKKARAGTLSIGGEKVQPNPKLKQSIKEIDDRITYLMSEESTPQRTSPEVSPAREETSSYEYVLPPRAKAAGDVLVPVKVEAVEQTFSKDPGYIAPGKEGVEGRRAGVEEFLKTGESVQAPEVHVNESGKVSFTDGRHRYAVLRDKGEKVVQVAMSPEAAENARKAGIVVETAKPVAPGASNVQELQQQQVVTGADILKGLKDSMLEPPSRELWEKNFLREYPERKGDTDFLDRAYKQSVRAVEQSESSPTKPMPEVVKQLDNPIPTEEPTSIKNAKVDQERQERGLPAMEPVVQKEFGTVWGDAIRTMDADPYAQTRLLNELRENPRPVKDTENAMLLHRQIELQNLYDKELNNLSAAYDLENHELIQEHQIRQREISDQLTDLYQINRSVGTEQGRGLAARKMLAMEDFSLAKMEARMRAEKNGEPLTPEESVKLVEMQKKITETETAFEKYRIEMDEKVATLEAQKAIMKVVEKVKKESAPKQTQIKRATEWLKSKADEARARIRARRAEGQLFSGPANPEQLQDYVIIGASHIAQGAGNFAKWSKTMVAEFGEVIRPYLKDIFAKAGIAAKEAPKQLTQEEQRTRTLEGIKARVAEGDTAASLGPYIQRLAENAVRGGITEREPLVNAVHTVLKDIVPGITTREVQDAISGYGKFSQLSHDEVKVKLRDLKGQLQQVSKIEDMQAKTAPKKTGVERRVPSAEERRLIKEVNELKKKGGFTVTDPATQLKTALGAIKTRLRNQIADLDLAISKGERIPTKKGGTPYDTEANVLKAQRDVLKEQYDSIFTKPELTDEQRIQQAKGAVDRSIKEYEERIKNGDLARRQKKPGPTSPELEVMRSHRDALKAELEELRASDSWLQEQKVQEGLKKSIAGIEDKLATGEPAKVVKAGPESKEVSDLRVRREALQDQLKAVREASPETLNRRIESTVESLDRSITEYDRRLKEGDFSKRQTKPPLETPEIEALRAERDAMRKLHQELVNAQKPNLSADEVALKAAKSRLKTMKAQYERKLEAGDFESRRKREFPVDQEFLKLKAENTIAKEEYLKALFDARMAARPAWKKFAGGIGETLNTSRALLTSFDLSAVLRQGGFIAFGNPVRAAKAVGPMFRALRSERNRVRVMEEIRNDPAYTSAEQAKLFLSEEGSVSLTKMEEAYAARWASKIPGVAASSRAYTTFLNKLRFDSFKAMTETLTKSGTPTPAEAKAIANYINVATGRGSIHSSMSQAASGLNMVFFAPRYATSRFQLLLGQPFYGGTARTRTLVAREYAKMLTGVAIVYGLGMAAGAQVNMDPGSSDFLKLKFGNTRVDPLFGLVQVTTFMYREIAGKTTDKNGVVKLLNKENKGSFDSSRGSVGARFLRTKLAPIPGTLVSLSYGEDLIGRKFGLKEAVIHSVVPISFGDIYRVMQDQGVPAGTAFSILALFGAGVQTYKTDPPRGRGSSDPFSSRARDPFKERKSKGL